MIPPRSPHKTNTRLMHLANAVAMPKGHYRHLLPFREIIKKPTLLERLYSIFGPKNVALTTHKLEGSKLSRGHGFDPSLGQKLFLVKSACMWFKKNIGIKCIIFHFRHFLINPKFEDHHRFSQNFEIWTPSYFSKKWYFLVQN